MPEERKLYTLAEVAKHDKDDDCWIVMHGMVVKVDRALQNEHPGGPEVILALAGKDVTTDFEDIGHSDAAREWTDKLIVGTTKYVDEEKKEAIIPRNKDLQGEGGGVMGVLPLILAVLVAIGSYLYLNA